MQIGNQMNNNYEFEGIFWASIVLTVAVGLFVVLQYCEYRLNKNNPKFDEDDWYEP